MPARPRWYSDLSPSNLSPTNNNTNINTSHTLSHSTSFQNSSTSSSSQQQQQQQQNQSIHSLHDHQDETDIKMNQQRQQPQPTIRQQVSQATEALKNLPSDHPAATTHFLTRSSLYLRYYEIARNKPSHQPPAIAYLQHSIRDAKQATQNAPSLPAAWLALFSATSTAGKLDQAKQAIDQGLIFCPYDPSLQATYQSFTASTPTSSSGSNQSIQTNPLRHRSKDHLLSSNQSQNYIQTSASLSKLRSTSRKSAQQQQLQSRSSFRFHSGRYQRDCASTQPEDSSPPSSPPPPPPPPLSRRQSMKTRIQHHKAKSSQTLKHSHSTKLPKSETNKESNMQKLQIADDALLLGAHDDAIAKYTALLIDMTATTMSSKDDFHADITRMKCLARRSDAWLKKAVQTDNLEAFSMAIADGKTIVAETPKWEQGWLRLGNAHLENACPGKAQATFQRGLTYCPNSDHLTQALHDAEYVIKTEGYETDWNGQIEDTDESSSNASDLGDNPTSGDTMEEITIARPKSKRHRAKENMRRVFKRQSSKSRINARRDSVIHEQFIEEVTTEASSQPPSNNQPQTTEDLGSSSVNHSESQEDNKSNEAERERRESFMSTADKLSAAHYKLYELLEIPKDATGATIKRSYYNLARRYHPDKNQDDVEATDKFQQLAEAYRILSDPESRAVYDRYGDRGRSANSVDSIDPRTLFAMVFGSDQFVSLIGELQLASLASNVDESGNVPSEEVLNQIQRSRVGKLALEMVKMLKPWVDGDKKGFLRNMQAFKLELLEAKYGPRILKVVGDAYLHYTTFLDDKTRAIPFSGVIRKAQMHSHRVASHHRAVHAAEKVMEKQRKLHDRVVKSGKTGNSISQEEAKDIAIEMAETAIDMMWKISIIDIESTLEEVILIVINGRDLIADESFQANRHDLSSKSFVTQDRQERSDRWKTRKRITSHLTGDRKDHDERREGGLSHVLPPLKHGQAATSRHQILSERARGIRAMGGLFRSKPQ